MGSDCTLVLAHFKYLKATWEKKADQKDTKWITDIFKHNLVSGNFIPSADIRQLRDLIVTAPPASYKLSTTSFQPAVKGLSFVYFFRDGAQITLPQPSVLLYHLKDFLND